MTKQLTTLVLVLLLAAPAIAQDRRSDAPQTVPLITEAEQWTLNRLQLVESLKSPITLVRTQSLKNAIVFATLYRDKINMNGAVGPIEEVFQADPDMANRKLALAALQAIGTSRARFYLAHATPAEFDAGRALMVSVLSEFYTTRPTATPTLSGSF